MDEYIHLHLTNIVLLFLAEIITKDQNTPGIEIKDHLTIFLADVSSRKGGGGT
jgi:hypothetical protein